MIRSVLNNGVAVESLFLFQTKYCDMERYTIKKKKPFSPGEVQMFGRRNVDGTKYHVKTK